MQVRQKDTAEVRRKIMDSLGFSSRPTWNMRRNGSIEPKMSEAKKIEAVFAEYGISDVWGAK